MLRQKFESSCKRFGCRIGYFLSISAVVLSCARPNEPTKDIALYFDGQDDKVVVFDNDDAIDSISKEITLEAWIFVKDIQDIVGRIIDRSDNQLDDRYVIEVYLLNENPVVHLNINRNSLWSQAVPVNKWMHVAGTYDGEQLNLYVDGELVDSMKTLTIIDVNESDLIIGHGGPNSGYKGAFHGYLNYLMLWSKARTQKAIQNDMRKNISPDEDGLICFWKADEGSDQVLGDYKRNAPGQLGSTNGVDDDDPSWISGY